MRKKTNLLCGYCLTVYWANSPQLYLTSVIGPLHFSFTKNELGNLGVPVSWDDPPLWMYLWISLESPSHTLKCTNNWVVKYFKFIMMSPPCWDKTWSTLGTFMKIDPSNRSLTYRAYTFLEFYVVFFSMLPNLTMFGKRIDRHCQLHPSFHTFQLFALILDNFSGLQCNGGGSGFEHFTVDSRCLPGLSQKGVTLPILETKADNLTNLMNKGLR